MKETYLFDNNFNNVIFAQRNKAYGAYTLRREYGRHIMAAAVIAIMSFAAALTWPLLLPKQSSITDADTSTKSGKVILIDQPALPPLPEPTPKEQPVATTEKKIKTIKSTTIAVVPDSHPGQDEVPPKQDDLRGALIGTQNIDGEPLTNIDLAGIEGTDGNSSEGNPSTEATAILDFAEEMPYFEGGEAGLLAYISKRIRYPRQAVNAEAEGIVVVSFVVNRNGRVTDATVLKGLGYGTEEEALRVITNMPAWTPGKQNGKAVAVRYTLPIRFNLQR